MFQKVTLQIVEFTSWRQSFNSENCAPSNLPDGNQTGIYGFTIKQYSAGAAFPDATTLLGTEQTEVVPQEIEQPGCRITGDLMYHAVDC